MNYKAICRICNKKQAEFPALNIPLGGDPGSPAKKVFAILTAHLATRHTEQFSAGMALSKDFNTFMVASQFTTEEPSILARAELIRAGLHGMTQRYGFTDEHVEQMVARLEIEDPGKRAHVKAALQELRDLLTEAGKYAPVTA